MSKVFPWYVDKDCISQQCCWQQPSPEGMQMTVYKYSEMIQQIFFTNEIIEIVDDGVIVFENASEHQALINNK